RFGGPVPSGRWVMTTTAVVELGAPLRALVDERLDAIDRVLLHAGVSRGERRDIGEAVAAQIDDLLARRAGEGALTRADVLAVLAQLDPPEPYAPEGYEPPAEAPRPRRPRGPRLSLLAGGAAALGAFALC